METATRGWEPIGASRVGIQIACINDRCQATTENNVPSRKDQNCCRDEEPTRRRKSGAYTKDGNTGSVEALTREGRADGRGDRCSEIAHQADRIGGGRDIKTSSHRAGSRGNDREEQPIS
jgi:hypothetical protein